MVKVASLEADIKINAGDASKKLDEVSKKLDKLDVASEKTARNTSLNWITAVGSLMNGAQKVIDFLDKQANRVGELSFGYDKLTRITGRSAQEFQKWKAIIEQNGGSFDDFMNTIQNLQKIRSTFLMKGTVPEVFSRLGIMPSGDELDILEKVTAKLKDIKDVGLRNYFAQEAGISPDLIGILTSDRVNGYFDRSMALTDKQIEAAKEVEKSSRIVAERWGRVFDKIGALIGTPLKQYLTESSEYWVGKAEDYLRETGGFGKSIKAMREAGLSENAIAGILGNAYVESSFNPNAKNGSHKGLFQWDKNRWTEYQKMLKQYGEKDSLENQMAFMLSEVGQMGSGFINRLNTAGSPEEAARIFEAEFERSGGQLLNKRLKSAAIVSEMLKHNQEITGEGLEGFKTSVFSPSGGAYSGVSNFSEFNRGGDTSSIVINNDVKISTDRVDANSIKGMNKEQIEKVTSGAVNSGG